MTVSMACCMARTEKRASGGSGESTSSPAAVPGVCSMPLAGTVMTWPAACRAALRTGAPALAAHDADALRGQPPGALFRAGKARWRGERYAAESRAGSVQQVERGRPGRAALPEQGHVPGAEGLDKDAAGMSGSENGPDNLRASAPKDVPRERIRGRAAGGGVIAMAAGVCGQAPETAPVHAPGRDELKNASFKGGVKCCHCRGLCLVPLSAAGAAPHPAGRLLHRHGAGAFCTRIALRGSGLKQA